MRKSTLYALVAVIAVLAVATGVLYTQNQKVKASYTEVKASESDAQNRYSETIDAIAEIQDSLNAISTGEPNTALSTDLKSEQNLRGPNGREALDRIALLRSSIARNKQRINQLESSLQKRGVKVAGLQKLVANLKHSVEEKEAYIATLTTQVDSLQTTVSTLATVVQEKSDTLVARDNTLEERRKELATVYYVVGTKKDLKDSGLIKSTGGVLGLGKTIKATGKADEVALTPIDTDMETVVKTNATKLDKVQVLSAQPPGSYELRLADGQVELHILDPQQFRKVKQLVILTA